ncbi:hypothetical protein ACFY1P_08720 [Streptomyces sp. NPDC001407]|uniref:hypothetical protein n=1 Tax=Streptomyces sp. NPDC001407 TaxID=3364573 RepID=UPI003688AE62
MPGVDGMRAVPMERPGKPEAVLRVLDARSGGQVEVGTGHRSPLRVFVQGARTGAAEEPSGLRARLVADVLLRTAELHGGQALLGLVRSGGTRETPEARAAVLGIRPPAASGTPEEIAQALGGRAHVYVTAGQETAEQGVTVRVGAVRPYEQPSPIGLDALALRLALLTHPHHEPVALTPDELAAAQRTLERWRRSVADWARAPSKPMCAEALGRALAGLEADLDVPVVLDALNRLESEAGLPDGSKFETFTYLDRVLALELTREIGHAASYDPLT